VLRSRKRVEEYGVLLSDLGQVLPYAGGVEHGIVGVDTEGERTAHAVVVRILPVRRKDVDGAHGLYAVHPERLVEASSREGMRSNDERTFRAEQRDVVVEARVISRGALEQGLAKAHLHEDQHHGKRDEIPSTATSRRSF